MLKMKNNIHPLHFPKHGLLPFLPTWYIQEMSVLKIKMRQLFSKSMLIDWKQ
jgi:hypothetical protein